MLPLSEMGNRVRLISYFCTTASCAIDPLIAGRKVRTAKSNAPANGRLPVFPGRDSATENNRQVFQKTGKGENVG
jgi:hypothetical protein